jgi:hypothetical protein
MCVLASAIVDIVVVVVVVLCWNMMALVAGGNGRIFKHESQFRTSTLQESVQPELAVPDAGRNAAALSLMHHFSIRVWPTCWAPTRH